MLRAGRCVFEKRRGLICGHAPNDLRRSIYCCKDRLIRGFEKIGWVRSIQVEKRGLRAVAVRVSTETAHVGSRLTTAKACDQLIRSKALKLCLHACLVSIIDQLGPKRWANLVREPVSKPVKEEEGAQARDGLDECLFALLLTVLGFDPDGPLPGWWQGWPPREHVRRWQTDLRLSDAEILEAAEASRQEHPEPPDGPKGLDRVMQRAAQRKSDAASQKRRKPKPVAAQEIRQIADLPVFYAEMVNSDRYVPVSAISNSMRDAMLARGLVTAERLRERGIR